MNRKLTVRPAVRHSLAPHGGQSRAAFTLTELMVSMAILGLIMVMLFGIFEQVNKAWLNGENRVETFTQARAIMDLMSRELSQAVATPKISFFGGPNKVCFVAPVNTAANQADL
jgi:prepilin-type N-terminal cleavage/methylation domain-containing protein